MTITEFQKYYVNCYINKTTTDDYEFDTILKIFTYEDAKWLCIRILLYKDSLAMVFLGNMYGYTNVINNVSKYRRAIYWYKNAIKYGENRYAKSNIEHLITNLQNGLIN